MKNHGGILPSIMAAERSNGAPGGAPVRPMPPHECPYSRMLATDMCTKDVWRRKLIGVVLGDDFTIALGDMGQKQRKSLVSRRREVCPSGGLAHSPCSCWTLRNENE